jgi:oligopeptidase B
MVSCGLADPRVPYWEPIKFVAKLREFKQSKENQLLLRIGTSGHFGASQEEEMVEWITFALANT